MRLTNPALAVLCAALLPTVLAAQLEPPATGGAVALAHELRMLGHYKRVLMIGAHPDDEDTELLTVLVRGQGAEAAYLSLTRGEGGQNLIGAELGEGLGLIRTEELLAARRLDGARQFFTRAYDFGYSKTVEDAWRHWPRDSVLKDVVRIIRRFRPQVVVSVFSGTSRDGHGQHQAAGWAAREAFDVAGDPRRFPDAGPAWAAAKLYRSARFDSAAATLTLEGGVLDAAVGQSYRQIAMRGRSLHRSQDMGQLQRIGPSEVRLTLVEDRTGRGAGGLWDGVDTTLAAMAAGPAGTTAAAGRRWAGVAARADSLRRGWPPGPDLGRALAALSRAYLADTGRGITPELAEQVGHLRAAAAIASGTVLDAVADDDRVIPGQVLRVTASVWNTADQPVTGIIAVVRAGGPEVEEGSRSWTVTVPPGAAVSRVFELPVPADAGPTQPYFLRLPPAGDFYRWGNDADARPGDPFESPPWLALGYFSAGRDSVPFDLRREVTFRSNNQAVGEVRRPVVIVPRVDVKLDPATEVWPAGSRAPQRFTVTLTHGARDTTAGEVWLEVPAGWPVPARQGFRLGREDERRTFEFSLEPPAALRPGTYEVRAFARGEGGATWSVGAYTVDYPHIRPRQALRPASATVRAADLAVPRLTRVGYVRGAADQVPEALQGIGIPVELVDRTVLERGDLSRYDAIVIGPRAYETDSALVENTPRILDYVRRGGLVITQYQQYGYFTGGFAPWPLAVGGQPLRSLLDSAGTRPVSSINRHDRVTDEDAPVVLVDPPHPAVLSPNRLGAGDWTGWVQERGLYFARAWNPAWRTVLETHDPGEEPLEGGLLVARLGRGTYVYTGLSFFRQLPAGVPGAFRLFVNLLALGQASTP